MRTYYQFRTPTVVQGLTRSGMGRQILFPLETQTMKTERGGLPPVSNHIEDDPTLDAELARSCPQVPDDCVEYALHLWEVM